MKNKKAPIALLFASLLLLGFASYDYFEAEYTGVYCKDCGNEMNCWQGNGLDSGYQSCQVNYDSNGEATGCDVNYWGDCQKLYGGRPGGNQE